MGNEKETKKKLLESAMKEFSEKGFMKASLRNICKQAGVTTGALYFFFKDKEDLFGNLVEEPLKRLESLMLEHYTEELDMQKGFSPEEMYELKSKSVNALTEDREEMDRIIECLFAYKPMFDLVLTKAQGSHYEHIVDHFVDKTENHYTMLYMVMKGIGSKKELTREDKFIIHWMSHDQIEIFIHILSHCKNVEEGKKQAGNLIAYMVGGWLAVVSTE